MNSVPTLLQLRPNSDPTLAQHSTNSVSESHCAACGLTVRTYDFGMDALMTQTTALLAGREVTVTTSGGTRWEIDLGDVLHDAIVGHAEKVADGYGVSAARIAVEMTDSIVSLVTYKEGEYGGRSLRGDAEWTLPQALEDVQDLLGTDQLERQAEAVARRLARNLPHH